MPPPAGLQLDYVSLDEYESAGWPDVLGMATFDGAPAPTSFARAPSAIPIAQVRTPLLRAGGHIYEVWRYGEAAESGQRGRVRVRRGGDLLFGCIALAESEVLPAPGGSTAHSALQVATSEVYREICATLDAERYPHLLRIWNYLPDINGTEHGSERYGQFNGARRRALRACGRALEGNVPAASVLGSPAGSPLVVYFLAGRTAPTFLENPRQVSAYHYPSEYGAHRPSFSRAALLRQPGSTTLFVSGTASIVGHRSLHPEDTAAQTRETLANIEALLGAANRAAAGVRFELGALACKVYLRRSSDLPLVQAELHDALGAGARVIYLQADVCRQDLLVEIEAAAIYPAAA